ncbi:MAG: laccase, partial [candidate division Zixibacteria bacterium]|nr:laccase [candidate division Zixibacteria bacterium]
TAEKDIAISVHTADCLPILVYHPDGFIAAVHAGWRGTLQKIALKTASAMAEDFGIRLNDLKFVFMPAIRGCCYEVGAEVAVFFENRGYNDKGELYIDVTLENIAQLRDFGIPGENITVIPICTNCFNGFDFPSFRKEGLLIRRSVNFIACQS